MCRLNINKHTFAAVKLLNQLGFEEDVVTYFINQPIIREYVRLTSLANDNSSSWTTEKVTLEIDRLYPTSLDAETLESISNVSLDVLQGILFNPDAIENFNVIQQALFNKFKAFSFSPE